MNKELVLTIAAFQLAIMTNIGLAQLDNPHNDPSKVLGAESCAKCHDAEIAVWKKTPHYDTFKKLHRKPEAKQIAERMGLRSIKRGETCLKCHYTEQDHGGATKAISGISCESCHGASQDWIKIHNDYGGPNISKLQETPEHKTLRREKSIANGMRNPSNLYLVARSCLNCHTTPDENLVNVGQHPTGSLDFELVAWSQGMVHHNFVASDGKHNSPSTTERLRVMYIAGTLADLEFSLRATAQATTKAKFATTSALRANTMRKKLAWIQSHLNHPTLQQAVDAANEVELKLDNKDQLIAAADKIADCGFEFAKTASGTELGAIDALLPDKSKYK
ncbi:MAG: cytochrome c family protein [Planctomycetales bacterium]|nr:cytochrome c family protein [Planctomycetales bacterium]